MMANTLAAQTVESLPIPTQKPPIVNPSLEPTLPPTETPSIQACPLPTESLTPVFTTTPVPLPTHTSAWITIDELPKDLPTAPLKLENKSNGEVSLTLYVMIIPQGYQTILSYDFNGTFIVEVPQGNYTYVAYLGGNKIVGSFGLRTPTKLTLTFYKDKVAVH